MPGGGTSPFFFADSSLSEKDLLRHLRKLERRLLAGDRRVKKALALSFHDTCGVRAIVNTHGVSVAESSRAVSFSAEILGAVGKETETCWGSAEKRTWTDLDPVAVVDDTRERLLTSFGSRSLRSGEWPVLFTPRVGAEVMELFSQAVLADGVQKGRSFVSGRLGKKVASRFVIIVDDGTLPGGLATSRWDDEGIPKQRTLVVGEGILRSYLHDTATGGRASLSSTGNAFRAGRDAPPAPGATNFYLSAGDVSRESLYKNTARAFEVRDVIGMHTADPVSGDFSVGASGTLWERGKPSRAVRGVTLSGNLLTLLTRVDAVANDLTWQGTFGSPTFRVSGLSVGGSR
jgi:PmbA protein